MKDLKEAIRAVQATVPEEDDSPSLVDRKEVKKDLEEIRERSSLVEGFKRYKRVEDLLSDYSLEAGKQLVYESQYGKTSGDRTRASEILLNRSKGKPADKASSVTMDVDGYTDNELDSEISKLMSELGYSKKSTGGLLLD